MRQRVVWFMVVSVILGQDIARGTAAELTCQEAQEVLGLSLTPKRKQGAETASGLIITDIAPLSQGARIGLQKGDIIEQVNSWRSVDCQSYSRAVQDARQEHKALLLLITRNGRRQPLAFAPEIWQRQEEEKQEKEAVAALETMLSAPLPTNVQQATDQLGAQALATLQALQTAATQAGHPEAYAQEVAKAQLHFTALDQASQGEAEKRVAAGAKVLLGYYVAAQEIRQYKQDFIESTRKDLRRGRNATFMASTVPYFLESPVPEWIDKYPFLLASVHESPRLANRIEWPGSWDPDLAVQLLWEKAKEETENFSRWLKGNARTQQSAVSGQ